MNEKIINELKNAYVIKDNDKDKFISSIKKNDMSALRFIFLQLKYLHSNAILKSISLIIVMISICFISNNEDAMLFVSVGIPLISLVMILEIETSKIYRMEELEQTTRFSLKMLVLSRLLIMGVISLLCVIVITIFTCTYKQIPLVNIICFFFLPYLITIYISLIVIRIYRDTGTKYCFIVSSGVSLSFVLISRAPLLVTYLTKPIISILMLVVSFMMVILESKKYIDNLEDCLWN